MPSSSIFSGEPEPNLPLRGVVVMFGCWRRYHALLCRSAPAPDDDVMGYHGVGGDDDDDVIVKQPARRPVESAL